MTRQMPDTREAYRIVDTKAAIRELRHYRAFIRRSSPRQIWLENRRRDRLMAEVVRLELDPLGEELKVIEAVYIR